MTTLTNLTTLQEDSSIQILDEVDPMECQFCSVSLQRLTPERRQAHYERHLDGMESGSENNATVGSTNPNKSSNQPNSARISNSNATLQPTKDSSNAASSSISSSSKENVFWYPGQSRPPPPNFTPGLIPVLKRILTKTHARGLTTRAVLCHPGTTHISSESWDIGWGCGYRNFLMACTALMNQQFQPMYFPLLDDPEKPPGVRNLQYWVENAWADGFDRDGAKDLKNKLVGTKKWIGTAELYVAFTFRGIPAQLVDFPGSERGPAALTEWVINYFAPKDSGRPSDAFNALRGASPITISERMPLILQHQGHSRTIVGYELNKKGEANILVFDPSTRLNKELRRAALTAHSPDYVDSLAKETGSSVLSRLFHSGKDRKRRLSDNPSMDNQRETKRTRGGDHGSPNNEVIIIDDDDDDDGRGDGSPNKGASLTEELDPVKILSVFRLNQSKLGRKSRYQILYFLLDSPLEEKERWERRVVTSDRIV